MSANKKYKDSVFTLLFGTPEKMLELYNAVSGNDLPGDTPLTVATLTDALFMDRINDLAFVIEGRLVVMIEHQSTICKNMPLRLLLYIARVYERLVDKKSMYRSGLISLPRPEFYVLYNGTAPMTGKMTLKLSDAFMDYPEIAAKFCPLELEVAVINVNVGYNEADVGKSESLSGYVKFIDKVNECRAKGMSLEDAIEAAAKYCIDSGVLVDFLDKNSREVRNMLFTEFNLDDALDVRFEEGMEEGIAIGEARGEARGEVRGEDRAKRRLSKNLLSMGLTIEQICIATGLSVAQIEHLHDAE